MGVIEYPSYTLNRPDKITFPAGSRQDYTYDALLRLERLSAPDAGLDYQYTPTLDDEAYTYDGVGNRETASDVSGTITHNDNHELTVYGEMAYQYDANGNMIRKSVGTAAVKYIYNVENRLIRVEDELSGLVIAEYSYDPFGRRLWKEVGGVRTYFFYANEGLVAEYHATGTEIKTYGYRPDSTWTTSGGLRCGESRSARLVRMALSIVLRNYLQRIIRLFRE